ncbi:MAG: TonB-dependent receptor [Bacteroidetes bacterium]|nr:TonB-dependent receptor [Bacteroidota bacterium]
MRPLQTINCFFLLILFPFTSSAQTQDDTLRYQYPGEVTVTAGRLPQALLTLPFSASVVGAELLGQLPRAVAFDETMKLVPGVKVDNQANGARVHLSMRGQGILTERGIRGIRILQDGIPFNDPTGFAPDLFDLQYDNIARIEVMRGPAAAVYGGSASGGVVNVLMREAPPRDFFGEVSGSIGSNDFWHGHAIAGGRTETLNYWLSGTRAMGDGYRVHTHWRNTGFYGRLAWKPSDRLSVTPLLEWSDTYHENPEGINLQQYQEDERQANPDAVPYNEFLETRRGTVGADVVYAPGMGQMLRVTAYAKSTRFTEANNHTFNHRDITTPGLSAQYNMRIGRTERWHNTISLGTDLQTQIIDERRNDNILSVEGDTVRSRERITQRGAGVFLLNRLDLGQRWSFQASLRYDFIDNKLEDQLKDPVDLSGSARFSRVTGRVGISMRATEQLSLFANWGQGFLPPATEELAQNSDHFGGFNTHLQPALSNSIEIGTRGMLASFIEHEVSVFYLQTDHDFDRYRITDPLRNQETFYRNVGGSDRIGCEVYLRLHPLQAVTVQTAYTYSDFRYRTDSPITILMDDPTISKSIVNGNLLPNSPAHQLMCDVEYRILPRVAVGGGTETYSKSYIDGANIDAEAVDGYTLVHVRASWYWRISGIEGQLSASVRNLGDVKYVAFSEPDPGGNAYQPGARREYFVSARLFF